MLVTPSTQVSKQQQQQHTHTRARAHTHIHIYPPSRCTLSPFFYSGPDSNSHERIRMTVRRSDDSGATWPYALRIDPNDGAYSCLVDGALIVGANKKADDKQGGVLYEAGGNQLRFVRFPLALNATVG